MDAGKWGAFVVLGSAALLAYWLGSRAATEGFDSVDAWAPTIDGQADRLPADAELAVHRVRSAASEMAPLSVEPGAATMASLPDADTPVLALIDQLEARARRGDARAACRLGVELLRCREDGQQARVHDLLQSSVDGRGGEAAEFEVDMLARMQERAEASTRRCAGITADHWRHAIDYQLLAAERGSARMRLWYAAEPALDPMFFLDNLEEWARYRAVAWTYIQEAMVAGVPEAPAMLARVYLPADAVHAGGMALRRPDAFQHFVHAELDRLLNPPPERPEPLPPGWFDPAPRPGPDIDMALVHAEVERLRQRYFSGHVVDQDGVKSSGLFTAGSDPAVICGESG